MLYRNIWTFFLWWLFGSMVVLQQFFASSTLYSWWRSFVLLPILIPMPLQQKNLLGSCYISLLRQKRSLLLPANVFSFEPLADPRPMNDQTPQWIDQRQPPCVKERDPKGRRDCAPLQCPPLAQKFGVLELSNRSYAQSLWGWFEPHHIPWFGRE